MQIKIEATTHEHLAFLEENEGEISSEILDVVASERKTRFLIFFFHFCRTRFCSKLFEKKTFSKENFFNVLYFRVEK